MNKPTYTIKPLYLGEMTRYEKSMHTFTFDYGVKMHSIWPFWYRVMGRTFWWTPAPKIWRSLKDITAMWRQTCPQRFTCSRSWKSTD